MTAFRRAVAVGGLVLLAAGAAWYVWPTPYRDFSLRASPNSVLAARQQRFSRRVDVLTRAGWRPLVQTADDSLAERMTELAPRAAVP